MEDDEHLIESNLIEYAALMFQESIDSQGHDEDICPCEVCQWLRAYEIYSGTKPGG